jgi:acyl carrier protein
VSQDLITRVQAVFHQVFGETVDFNASMVRVDEPQWTSLRHVEFIIALEREFGLRFDGADATDMTGIPMIVERIEQRLR